jgi:hypothetical protein
MARPLQTWKNKGLDIAAWPTKNGGISFTIRKTFKPKDATEWQESKSYFPNELAMLADLIKQATTWAHEEFGEPVSSFDTRPPHPKVAAIVKAVVEDSDDVPF